MHKMDFVLSPALALLLFATGAAAGFVDSIAGGGGLVALPVLLSCGVPPQVALGTNKLQGSFGTCSAAITFIRGGMVDLKRAVTGILATFTGAATGAWTIQHMQAGFLNKLIPLLLICVFFYTIFSPGVGDQDHEPKVSEPAAFLLLGLALGFYDGFFGPGTGSFWTTGLILLLGFNMTRAAGYTRVMNFTSNIVALSVFIAMGNVIWSVGLIMAGGQIIGARLGSGLAMKNGAKLIRPLFATVVFITTCRLIWMNYDIPAFLQFLGIL